ncbi:MFS transporter [Planomonospora parontospora subsp. parontospora]|uniref:MFS transporter n=2 Tax=Planomonospora parontospora TaxID=58119 RepID=A0AA37BP92_9ACTN|nr:DHA2 family efflux MFS transporter permease subunit [Planomonospora parontospora]GGK98375.1 MFS transporter [Planomonospora parontospora]GII11907.1 MFS transporter [Planomonospora parontospora subsp. parontospora]
MADLTHRRRMGVLAICCMSLLLVSLDTTILNVALPAIRREFDASVSGLQWTIDAYVLVLASLLMLAGSTADRIGRRRVFQAGLVLFTAGSVLCSLAPGLGWLVAFRTVQAVGGSMLNPVAMSIITNTFTDPRERARAIGFWGGVIGISMAAGPLIGGLLVETAGWRLVFLINLPVGLAALVLTAMFVPESRAARARRIDPVGQFLVILVLGPLTFGIIEAPVLGWTSPVIVACLATALCALAVLPAYERRRDDPLIDPRFFRSAPFAGAAGIAVCGFAALGGFLFVNTLYLQDVRGMTALHAGLYLLPMAAMMLLSAPLSGRLVAARGPRPPLLAAGTAMTLSGGLPAAGGLGSPGSSDALLLASFVLFGVGMGLLNAPVTNTAVSGMPVSQAGVAAGIASTSRQVGQVLGVAVVGSVIAAGVGAEAVTAGAGFTGAARTAWWIITGCGAAVLVLGAATTGPWARGTAERAAALIGAEGGAAPPGGRTGSRTG